MVLSLCSSWVILFSGVARDFICAVVISSARHMPMALSRVRLASFRSWLLVRSLKIPQTIRSLIRLSVSVPNSHVLALLRKSVAYWSIVSPDCWLQLLKTCLSHVPGVAVGFNLFVTCCRLPGLLVQLCVGGVQIGLFMESLFPSPPVLR